MLVTRSARKKKHEGAGRDASPTLSVGTHRAGDCTISFCEAATGKLLVLHHHFWRSAGGRGLRRGGNDPGPATAERHVQRIWQEIADPDAGDADYRQSVGRKLRRSGGVVLRSEAVCEGAGGLQPGDQREERFTIHILSAGEGGAGNGRLCRSDPGPGVGSGQGREV